VKQRPRRRRVTADSGQDDALVTAEAELVKRYPNRKFKPGSLLPAGALAEYGNKRSIIILCNDCGAERRLATSDVFHVSRCEACSKAAKKKLKAKAGTDE
jgi:hypothetical protein